MSATESLQNSPSIPAWKRLGLKLKRSEDNATTTNASVLASKPNINNNDNSSMKRSRDGGSNSRLDKRRRTETSPASANNHAIHLDTPRKKSDYHVNSDLMHETPHSMIKTSKHIVFDAEEPAKLGTIESKAGEQGGSRRKSVAFTPDTKTEDGFSAHNLFKAWSAQQSRDTTVDPAKGESPSWTASKKQRKSKPNPKTRTSDGKNKEDGQVKSENQSRDQTLGIDSDTAPSYVDYLTQFYSSRADWKFNKNKQTDLLKHLFDLKKLSADLDPAIVSYICGLRGLSARERVLEEATTILSDLASDPSNTSEGSDIYDMETPKGRLAAYNAALQRQIARYEASEAGRSQWAETQLEEIRLETEKAVRAEKILTQLLLGEQTPEQDVGSISPSEGQGVLKMRGGKLSSPKGQNTKKRSRKSQTETEAETSSDSTISSDDGEDSGEKPIFDKKLLDRKFGKKRKT